jgi:hypothetical protein
MATLFYATLHAHPPFLRSSHAEAGRASFIHRARACFLF